MNASSTALWLPNASLPSSLETSSDINRLRDILKIIFYTVIFLLGSFGNGVVIWITAHQVSRTISCVWFFNLALADFLFSMSRIAPLVAVKKGWVFGSFACKVNGFIKYLNMFCSEFLLAAISMDRAACIAYPLWARRHRNIRLVWLAAIGAWLMAIVTSIPFYLYRKVDTKNNQTKCLVMLKGEKPGVQVTISMLRLICGFLAPFTIIVICYGIILVVLRRRQTPSTQRSPSRSYLPWWSPSSSVGRPITSPSCLNRQERMARPSRLLLLLRRSWPTLTVVQIHSFTSSWAWTSTQG